MAIGILTMLTPLEERIDRWATSGKSKQILLHPEDYVKINSKKDMIETKYNLPVVCLGGARALSQYLKSRESDDEVTQTAVEAAQLKSIEDYLDEE